MSDGHRLQVDSLTKTFDEGEREVTVLKGASLRAAAGDSVAIMGPTD